MIRNIPVVFWSGFCLIPFLLLSTTVFATDSEPGVPQFIDLSIEELMDVKITSVSKREQKLFESASAVYVITNDDIRRSGATSIPEALRMAPGLQVARIDSHTWAISSRGFNDYYSNKLLVLIDGRSVYTPTHGGVYWDNQDMLLEDVERIEVIRGPGATLWGANAVNGVINVISKNAKQTQTSMITGGGGSEEHAIVGARHGAEVGEDTYARVYAKLNSRDDTKLENGDDNYDGWNTFRGGLRVDRERGEDSYTLQGDAYYGKERNSHTFSNLTPPFGNQKIRHTNGSNGANVLGRWMHQLDGESDTTLQLYFDRVERNDIDLEETVNTYDIDFQHSLELFSSHKLIWGLRYNYVEDSLFGSIPTVAFEPHSRGRSLVSGFVQDEIPLVEDELSLTIGTKLAHNDFTGVEVQPSARALWQPCEDHIFWTAFSRAVRTPSRTEDDIRAQVVAFPLPDTSTGVLTLIGSRDFESEDLRAYEAGYRTRITSNLSIEFSAFMNNYHHLSTQEEGMPFPDPTDSTRTVLPIVFDNQGAGDTYGIESLINWRPWAWWRLQGWHAFLQNDIKFADESSDTFRDNSPQNQFALRSLIDLPHDFEFDSMFRFVDSVPGNNTDSYLELDLRVGMHVNDHVELSIVGQNLLDQRHAEFTNPSNVQQVSGQIERSVYGKVTWRF
ncbi:TonB-dependent receptor [Oligoflexia bacterium]|nr:TonB-dependent receptor [Oligoflexia bacterium]